MKIHGIETRGVELQVDPVSALDALRKELLKHASAELMHPRSLGDDDTIMRAGAHSEWAIVIDHGHHRGGTEVIPIPQGAGEFYGTALEKLWDVQQAFFRILEKSSKEEGRDLA
jgi:hypothetical protein